MRGDKVGGTPKEPTITTPASLAYAEGFVSEDPLATEARLRAETVGVVPIGVGAGAALQFLAGLVQAKAVVELGTGTGVSGLWLFGGMQSDGVLTSVDLEAENQRLARDAFVAAGIPSQRFRLIAGSALDVITRLTDHAYDLVFIDADKLEYGEYFEEAIRLVRPGGVMVFANALLRDKVADPAQRDAETVTIRELGKRVAEDERLRSILLPMSDGLLAAQLLG
ncbi:SAM-dependent O-methyltransferase [soil metagenome]